MINPDPTHKVAFVTGASRGIGKVVAVELANAGYDVAVTARTRSEGDSFEHSLTVKSSDTTPLSGSLSTTAALIEDAGQRALALPADLLDVASLRAVAANVLDQWGHVDVLVNSARYVGPGQMDLFIDTPIEIINEQIQANVLAPLVLIKELLPSMVERGSGTIINVTSSAAYVDIMKPAGQGGFGMGYGVSKGAFHRIAGFIACELGSRGIRCFNINPGLVVNERTPPERARDAAPPEVVSRTVAWLLSNPGDHTYNGTTIEAQFACAEHELLEGWDGPKPSPARDSLRYDHSAAELERLEDELAEQFEHMKSDG